MNFNRIFAAFSIVAGVAACGGPTQSEGPVDGPLFSENIRTTPARTPEEERLGFVVPPGFEVQLFASEPDIQKPMNLAFDAQGRMWVTQSFDYPFPSEIGKGSDHITILEDTDHDGRADKFTPFSDTLNIPIGIFPTAQGALAFSIPNIYRFTDSNLDGRADASNVMYGPFGYVDTHGMVSNFIRGFDGWIHACHGFTNVSNVAGADHDSIHMVSGNTFRFRLDGSRVEQTTFGQVNPFGLAYDEAGYVYSTDSHSSPLYQLVTGGDYPHFGKMEIMAFCPDMKPLVNEATALCGIAYYADSKFPKEFQSNLFIGDVINSRVHRYSYENKGSSPVGKSEDDFIKSRDPWFRPVNIKLGPDGALYVADFYNAVIGHYEVPLAHPLRDKSRGRIWRITYKGDQHAISDLSKSDLAQLINALNHDNLPVRMEAANQIVDRIGAEAVKSVQELLIKKDTPARQYSHALWILQRLGALPEGALERALNHSDALVRIHTMRILNEEPAGQASRALALQGVADADPHVRRAAVEVLKAYPDMEVVNALLSMLHQTPAEDTHLVYTSRLELRNVLRNEALMKQVLQSEWNPEEIKWIEGTLVDVYSEAAGRFLAKYINQYPLASDKTGLAYQQLARFIPSNELDAMVNTVMNDPLRKLDDRAAVIRGVRQGIAQRGGQESNTIRRYGSGIATELLAQYPAVDSAVSDEVAASQRLAAELAGAYGARDAMPALGKLLSAGGTARTDVKVAAFTSLLRIDPAKGIAIAGDVLMNDSVSLDFRKKVATTLSTYPGSSVNEVLAKVKNVPTDLEVAVAGSLASTPAGKKILFAKVKAGEIAARTLQNPRVNDRLMLNITAAERKEYETLTSQLTEISKEREQLIDARLTAFRAAKLTSVQIDSGGVIFAQNCGVCHRRVSKDAIGPPLAGIGKRGDLSIAEKILDPNRNIIEAFRNYTIKTKDGKVYSGVFRREQGAISVFADLTGTEFSMPTRDIVEKQVSAYTVMPDTFGSTLTQHEFNKLLAHLLEW